MRKKPHSIAFRVTYEQYKMIKEKAKKSNLSITDFIVKSCFDKEIIIVNDVRELMKELHAVGRNLNQLSDYKELVHDTLLRAVRLLQGVFGICCSQYVLNAQKKADYCNF